jgi:phage terminase large subunit-like protein
VKENHGLYRRWIIAGATASDVRDIMIEGESGILSISTGQDRPRYEPSKSRLTWPNGSTALLLTADEPDRFRGKQSEAAWADEIASWRYPEAWDQLQFGLRLGPRPRQLATTTPRPTPLIKRLVADPTTAVTRGSTYENRANLAPDFFRQIVSRYEGTRLGRQELHAEILDDVEGALWHRDLIRYGRAPLHGKDGSLVDDFLRVVVAIDPAVSYGPESDETGIVVSAKGADGLGYVLDDQSGRLSPSEWAKRAMASYDEHEADAIVAEVNNGGDLVESNLRAHGFTGAYIAVHASRGKRVRAEPIAGRYEQGKVLHLRQFVELEDQMCNFTIDAATSPDRVDALVWGMTELFMAETSGSDFSMIA